jgi:hypothetical protein
MEAMHNPHLEAAIQIASGLDVKITTRDVPERAEDIYQTCKTALGERIRTKMRNRVLIMDDYTNWKRVGFLGLQISGLECGENGIPHRVTVCIGHIPYDGDESADAKTISTKIRAKLAELGISDQVEYVIGDTASVNMAVARMLEIQYIPCWAHEKNLEIGDFLLNPWIKDQLDFIYLVARMARASKMFANLCERHIGSVRIGTVSRTRWLSEKMLFTAMLKDRPAITEWLKTLKKADFAKLTNEEMSTIRGEEAMSESLRGHVHRRPEDVVDEGDNENSDQAMMPPTLNPTEMADLETKALGEAIRKAGLDKDKTIEFSEDKWLVVQRLRDLLSTYRTAINQSQSDECWSLSCLYSGRYLTNAFINRLRTTVVRETFEAIKGKTPALAQGIIDRLPHRDRLAFEMVRVWDGKARDHFTRQMYRPSDPKRMVRKISLVSGFLNPVNRAAIFTEEELDEAVGYAREMCHEKCKATKGQDFLAIGDGMGQEEEPGFDNEYAQFAKEWHSQHRTADIDEVGTYRAKYFSKEIVESAPKDDLGAMVNPMFLDGPLWWHNHRKEFSHLYEVAMDMYALPASSASVERQFSQAKLVLTTHRGGSMLPETEQRWVWMAYNREFVIETIDKNGRVKSAK